MVHAPPPSLRHSKHVFDANLQKELLLEFEQNSQIKSQEFSKFVADKKALITLYLGNATKQQRQKLLLKQITKGTAKQEGSLSSSTNYTLFVLEAIMAAHHMDPMTCPILVYRVEALLYQIIVIMSISSLVLS